MWFSYADPDILRTIFYSGNIGNFNVAKYNDPDVDKLLLDAAVGDRRRRRARSSTRKIQLKVLDEAVTIPLTDSITYNAKRTKLEGDFLDFLASYVWMNDAHFTGVTAISHRLSAIGSWLWMSGLRLQVVGPAELTEPATHL